jgi:peptidoglycan hydrolase-like protein with peptidoglycan-binding domain
MILKKGDNNEIVKKIQAVLGVEQVGNFGPKTEEAVKDWQVKNGLKPDGVVGPATLAKMGIIVPATNTTAPVSSTATKYSKEKIEAAVKSKGYKWFSDKDFILNIVGVRNSDTEKTVTNVFDDKITVSYMKDGVWFYNEFANTTDPGKKGVKEFHNAKGVARLVPGQYINSYGLGLHQGKYEALKQFKNVKVYRDANRDMKYDENSIQEGIFGINIHKAGVDSTFVENWSEGCQVFKRQKDFEYFMDIVRLSAKSGSKAFTYTLIESKDIL